MCTNILSNLYKKENAFILKWLKVFFIKKLNAKLESYIKGQILSNIKGQIIIFLNTYN